MLSKNHSIVDRSLLVSAFLLAVIYSLRRMADTDLWAHLTCGEYLFRHGTILKTHFFNCSWPDFPYVNHSWLFQAVIYFVDWTTGESVTRASGTTGHAALHPSETLRLYTAASPSSPWFSLSAYWHRPTGFRSDPSTYLCFFAFFCQPINTAEAYGLCLVLPLLMMVAG
jgi:hypothetical protein